MNNQVQCQSKALSTSPVTSAPRLNLQRKCVTCGQQPNVVGHCEECSKSRLSGLQTKLAISQPGDPYEQEADRIAGQIMRMADDSPAVARSAYPAAPAIQRKLAGEGVDKDVEPFVRNVISSPGQPLDSASRAFFEPRFGHDFSQVRVHTDEHAIESARSVDALAYTKGQEIVFGAGQYQPHTEPGRRLIAHELTHTLQQRSASQPDSGALETSSPEDTSEREADAVTETVMKGQRITATMGSGLEVARAPDPDAGGGSAPDAATPDAGDGGAAPDGGAPGGGAPGGGAPAPGPGPAPVAAPVVTDITVANQADAITYPEASVLGAAGKKHFITVAGSGPEVIVEATVTGGPPAAGSITWTGATPDPGNPARATLSRATAGKRKVTATAGGGSASLIVWAVFAKITRVNGPTLGITPPTPPGPGVSCAGTSLCIWATINNDAEIFPKSIITDADRPNLAGASSVAVPGGTSPCLGGLAGGATLRWDFSRQTNISFEPKFAGVCVNTAFPGNNAEGNDDTNVADEMNDPYAGGTIAFNGRAVAAGFVGDTDAPKDPLNDAQGVPGDTDFMTATFREFVRLEYHKTWWLISHRPTWGIDFRAIKNAAGHWQDNGSTVS